MNIKKFEEYKFPDDHDDIGDEYAKIIISRFIDNDLDGKTMQEIYNSIIKEEGLEEEQEDLILESVSRYSDRLRKISNNLKTLLASEADKYNL